MRRPHYRDVLANLLRTADQIVESNNSPGFATSVRHLAESIGVKKVVFRPIPADALLTRLPHGFGIHINCADPDVERLNALYEKEGDPHHLEWLPPRIRFSVAHECAHIILDGFAEAYGGAEELFSKMGKDKVDLIEITCNKIAERILLPKEKYSRALFAAVEPYEPINVPVLALFFKVSPDVIVHSLGAHRRLLCSRYWKGAVYIVVLDKRGEWKIHAQQVGELFHFRDLVSKEDHGKQPFLGLLNYGECEHQDYYEFGDAQGDARKLVKCLVHVLKRDSETDRVMVSLSESRV